MRSAEIDEDREAGRSAPAAGPAAVNLNQAAWLLGLLVTWLWVWWRLSYEWRDNPQYQYAFAVPILAIYLASVALNHAGQPASTASIAPASVYGLLFTGWLFLLLGELIWQQDPTWRLSLGCLMLASTLLTLAWIIRSGGRPLILPFLFPIAFTWLALPWPGSLESWVITGLLRFLTGVTTDLLNALGIPALQRGSVIELTNGFLGMETACSGVQSFQASLMATLFLGAFLGLSITRRVWLVVLGIFIALLGNLARIIILSLLMHRGGSASIDRYHDGVGGTVTLATFAALYGLARAMGPRVQPRVQLAQPLPQTWLKATRPGHDGILCLGLLLATPILVQGWFWAQGAERTSLQKNPEWRLHPPESLGLWELQPFQLSQAERNILKYSQGSAIQARNTLGFNAYLYHFYWSPKARVSSAAFAHTPNICLPSQGWTQVGEPESKVFQASQGRVEALLYRFSRLGVEERVAQVIVPQPFFKSGYPVMDRFAHFSLLWRAPRQRVREVMLIYCAQASGQSIPDAVMEQLFSEFFSPRTD